MQEEITNSINSNQFDKSRTLARVSATETKRFLVELANLRDERAAVGRFRTKFAAILAGVPDFAVIHPERLRSVNGILTQFPDTVPLDKLPGEPADPKDVRIEANRLASLRAWLQSIWVAPNVREREWRVFFFANYFRDWGDKRFLMAKGLIDHVLPPTLFEHALLFLLKSADRLRYCGNPDCLTPYFFAKRRSQKYCSDACALPSQREFKRQWWAEHGEARRKARKALAKKSQRKRGK